MIKVALTTLFCWVLYLGIYHELTVAYVVYGIVAGLLGIVHIVGGVIATVTDDVGVLQKCKDSFWEEMLTIKTATQLLLTVPVFLYVVYSSQSWNTLCTWALLLFCCIGTRAVIRCRYNKLKLEMASSKLNKVKKDLWDNKSIRTEYEVMSIERDGKGVPIVKTVDPEDIN